MIKKLFVFLYHNIEEVITTILFLMLLFVVSLEIVMRWIFNSPLIWTFQTATLTFIYMIYIGMSIAIKKNINVGIDYLQEKIPKKFRLVLYFSFEVVILLVIITLILLSYQTAMQNKIFQLSTLPISQAWQSFAVVLGGFFMFWRQIEKMYKIIKSRNIQLPEDM